jgi:mRNA interferase YafQ
MRTIERTTTFKRDFKREKLSGRYKNLDNLLVETLTLLANDIPLLERYNDH